MPNIAISFITSRQLDAQALAEQLQLPLADTDHDYDYLLHYEADRLQLICCQQDFSPLEVDFISGSNWHRYRYGGGKSQLIAKACGIKTTNKPSILDLTGGLARDAFALASLGCDVTAIERHPVIAALVIDGLKRAKNTTALASLSLQLIMADAFSYLSNATNTLADVIYLDPMYPHREKSSLVKKDMRILRDLVGDDDDSSHLLEPARQLARKRVVVKRPYHAATLTPRKPDLQYSGKSARFDVYLCANSGHQANNTEKD